MRAHGLHLRVARDDLVHDLGPAEHVAHMPQKLGVLHHAEHHVGVAGVHAAKVAEHAARIIQQARHVRARVVSTVECREWVVGEVLARGEVGRHALGL